MHSWLQISAFFKPLSGAAVAVTRSSLSRAEQPIALHTQICDTRLGTRSEPTYSEGAPLYVGCLKTDFLWPGGSLRIPNLVFFLLYKAKSLSWNRGFLMASHRGQILLAVSLFMRVLPMWLATVSTRAPFELRRSALCLKISPMSSFIANFLLDCHSWWSKNSANKLLPESERVPDSPWNQRGQLPSILECDSDSLIFHNAFENALLRFIRFIHPLRVHFLARTKFFSFFSSNFQQISEKCDEISKNRKN